MARMPNPRDARWFAPALLAALVVACGEGARIEARPQVITFAPAPTPIVNQASATVSARASSGLPVVYESRSPAVCSVDAGSGVVTATVTGVCTIAANQYGSSTWAAAPQITQDVAFRFAGVITFGPAPALAVHDRGTVVATESGGATVRYTGTTPATCAVEAATGFVTALAAGTCSVTATAGDAQASQAFPIAAAGAPTLPGTPSGVAATAGDAPGTADVRVGALAAGGLPITAWTVTSSPPGATGSGALLPVRVTCPGSCAGYRFSVAATNGAGTGGPSAPGEIVTRYQVVATFLEPDTSPNDSIFIGTYVLNASTGVVSGLRGRLSEAMTGGPTPYPDDTMNWVSLDHQLSAVPVVVDGAAGWMVATFALPTTGTLSADPKFGGTDGWAPGTGSGLYYGFPGTNPGNSYVLLFVNGADPTATPTPGQVNRIAYADCASGGMMGATCMTGTSEAAYGTFGTMGGRPLSQVTTRE